MRYAVSAYLCTNNPIKIDSLKTDFWFEVEDFIWDNIERGFNCMLIDNETGDINWAYSENFNGDVDELVAVIRAELKIC